MSSVPIVRVNRNIQYHFVLPASLPSIQSDALGREGSTLGVLLCHDRRGFKTEGGLNVPKSRFNIFTLSEAKNFAQTL